MSLRAAIAALESKLAAKRGELQALQRTNERLKARMAALLLLRRVLDEFARCSTELEATDADHVIAQMKRVRSLVERAEEETVLAQAGHGAEASSSGGPPARQGSGTSADTAATSAQPPDFRAATPAATAGSAAAACSDRSDSESRGGPRDSPPRAAGSSTAGPGPEAAEAAAVAAAAAGFLRRFPHLAPGRTLLYLDDVPPAVLAGYRSMAADGAKDRWRRLVEEALLLQSERTDGDECARALAATAARMYRWKNLLLLLNRPAFMPLSYYRYDSDGTLMAHEAADAPPEHWSAAIYDCARVTRSQALLLVEAHRICEELIATLRADRAALSQELEGYTNRAPAHESIHSKAAFGGVGVWRAAQADICSALEDNTSAELAVIILSWIVLPLALSPSQWARFISHCWPFPASELEVCKLLDRDLDAAPEKLQPDESLLQLPL